MPGIWRTSFGSNITYLDGRDVVYPQIVLVALICIGGERILAHWFSRIGSSTGYGSPLNPKYMLFECIQMHAADGQYRSVYRDDRLNERVLYLSDVFCFVCLYSMSSLPFYRHVQKYGIIHQINIACYSCYSQKLNSLLG